MGIVIMGIVNSEMKMTLQYEHELETNQALKFNP